MTPVVSYRVRPFVTCHLSTCPLPSEITEEPLLSFCRKNLLTRISTSKVPLLVSVNTHQTQAGRLHTPISWRRRVRFGEKGAMS